ncbi:MAG: hypothetical protein KFKLKKLM_01611 [Flavobacteriales bacterium]|nr:hypothetical protein [Flavobacteriales bacterium]
MNNLDLKLISNTITISFLLFFSSCYSQQGHNGTSENIEESKKRKVFICEYTVSENPFRINDTLQITVVEAWLEKQWKYPKDPNETVIYDEFQLIINSKEEDIEGLDVKWSIGVDANKYIRTCSKSDLISDFNYLPTDTIEYLVQKGNQFKGEVPKENIIGRFVLIKKR